MAIYQKKHLGKMPFQIIQLNKNESGKKIAIQKGVLHSKKSFILTQDADIEFSSNFFSNLEKIDQDNLIILPVIFQTKKIINTDAVLANALNLEVHIGSIEDNPFKGKSFDLIVEWTLAPFSIKTDVE